MSRLPAAAALFALAVLSAGCGWLGASRPVGSDGGPRLSHAVLVQRVEAGCGRRIRALAALPRPGAKAERRLFFAQVAAIVRAEADALAALTPPSRDERNLARLLIATDELAAVSERFVVAVARNDAHERRRAVADADRAAAAYDRAARNLGVACRQ